MKNGVEILDDVGPNGRHIRYFFQFFSMGFKLLKNISEVSYLNTYPGKF
jgi:hypothetical protein